ncbi:MAG TPA: hypothetical protein VH481_05505 [Nitrososphaeraceae archaeon]|jgi:hypothetical protein
MKKKYVISTIILSGLIFCSILASSTTKASAETGVGNDVFKVVVTLYGITNTTKDIVTIVNVGDQIKTKEFNREDPKNEGMDKVSYTVTFPNLAVEDGAPYKVCTVGAENLKLKCEQGKNSPLNRPEFVDIKVS